MIREQAKQQIRNTTLGFALVASALAACGGPPPATVTVNTPPPPVVTTTTVQTPPPAPTTPTCSAVADYRGIATRAATVLNYNAQSNFGGGALTTGFSPDPWGFHLTAGGGRDPINVEELGLHDEVNCAPCTRSFVTRRPDFHFTFEGGNVFELVRFYVITDNGADATMLINQPDTTWRCNDDHGRPGWGHPTMPAIDIMRPASGRYDIWVGSYDRSASNPATLYVTEINTNHP